MQSQDFEVLDGLHSWLTAGIDCWLCTVVATYGSAPRPVGSLAAFSAEGAQLGSLSGGCVEEELLRQLLNGELPSPKPQHIEYGVSAQENERLGLPCGGRLALLVEQLGADDQAAVTEVIDALKARQCIERMVDLESGAVSLAPLEKFKALQLEAGIMRQCFGPRQRMLLVGAGQLAKSLAELALAMDFEVLVTDPREDALAHWSGPDVPLMQGMPDDVVREHATDEQSLVITLTHDPRIDDMALMEALETRAWYVGALGSLRTTQARIARLRDLGVSEANLGRLHAPVGLDIGSKTPIEIAVSIMAQLTQLKRGAHP